VTGVAGTAGHRRHPDAAPTDNVTPTQPVLMRFLVRLWEYRHPRAWVRARFACGIFNLGLGVLLLSLSATGGKPLTATGWERYR
jgi:hypothetical protein